MVVPTLALAACGLCGCGGSGAAEGGGSAPEVSSTGQPAELDPARQVKSSELIIADKPALLDTVEDSPGLEPVSPDLARTIMQQHLLESDQSGALQKAGSAFNRYYPSGGGEVHDFLGNSNDYMCYPVLAEGRMRTPNYGRFYVGLDSFENTGNIYAQKSSEPIAEVRCVPRTAFTPLPSRQTYYNYIFVWDGNPCGDYSGSTEWHGDYATWVAGIGYDYASGSDNFRINQATSTGAFNTWGLAQHSSACKGVGYYSSMLLRGGVLPKFKGPQGTGTAASIGVWNYTVQSGTYSVNLADYVVQNTNTPFNSNECFFTFLGGSFTTADDYAYLTNYSGNWRLFLGAGTGGVRAMVRCIPHAQ
jgi:hypothetical protein